MSRFFRDIYNFFTLLIGKISRKYYFEDYVRVYPDGIIYDRLGRRRTPQRTAIINYINHTKFYKFVAQFVNKKRVADIGCGSGYGCEILKNAGAIQVSGSDISKNSIKFARHRFGKNAEYLIQGITDLNLYKDDSFDITVCSEVLEHIKEYGQEHKAIKELKRITVNGGLLIVGTPNNEMLPKHGFSFCEINALFKKYFSKVLFFENALVPSGEAAQAWNDRLRMHQTGIIITENINPLETVLADVKDFKIKEGLSSGIYGFEGLNINTALLHNTHSWVVLAINDKGIIN